MPSSSVDWANAANAQGASDDVGATVVLTKPGAQVADFIQCTGFGFSIPLGSRIDKITVKLRRVATVAGSVYAAAVSPLRPFSSSSNGGYWGTSYGTDVFDQQGLWSLTWTVADINDSGFGFKTRADFFGGADGMLTATLDSMELTIDYSAGPPTISKQFGDASIPVNDETLLSITITNPNAGTALSGLAFTDTLPAGLVVATPNGMSNTCNGTVTATAGSGSVSLTGGSMFAASTCTIAVNVKATSSGEKSNTTSTVSATESGEGSTSNTAILTVTVPELIDADGFEDP